jgi:DNA-binding IclR family transcriptional regulator
MPVKSVAKAFKVLDALNERPLNPTELSKLTALPRSTALRMLKTLINEGYVSHYDVNSDRKYFVTQKTRVLCRGARAYLEDYSLVRQRLEALATKVKWPVYLTINDGFQMDVLESTEASSPYFLRDSILGQRLPLFSSASGLAFLAACRSEDRVALMGNVDQFIDGQSGYDWVMGKLASVDNDGCVLLKNCDKYYPDRPVSSLSIGFYGEDRAVGAVTVRYYDKATPAEQNISQWRKAMVDFRDSSKNAFLT